LIGQEEEARQLIAIIYKPEFVEDILRLKKLDLETADKKESLRIMTINSL
jgi:hypothetical protein